MMFTLGDQFVLSLSVSLSYIIGSYLQVMRWCLNDEWTFHSKSTCKYGLVLHTSIRRLFNRNWEKSFTFYIVLLEYLFHLIQSLFSIHFNIIKSFFSSFLRYWEIKLPNFNSHILRFKIRNRNFLLPKILSYRWILAWFSLSVISRWEIADRNQSKRFSCFFKIIRFNQSVIIL